MIFFWNRIVSRMFEKNAMFPGRFCVLNYQLFHLFDKERNNYLYSTTVISNSTSSKRR